MQKSHSTRARIARFGDAVIDNLATVERVVSALLMALLLVVVLVQVFMRYVMNAPLAGTDELARFTLVWLTFVAAALLQWKDEHIAVLVLRTRGSERWKRGLRYLANVVALAIGVVIVYVGVTSLKLTLRVTSPSLEIPIAVVYLGVILGFFLIVLHSIRNIVNIRRFGRVAEDKVEDFATDAKFS